MILYHGKHKTGVKGKDICKVCGYPFGMGELKKGEDRKEHICQLIPHGATQYGLKLHREGLDIEAQRD